jgi:outer membrane protein insertion porin family
MALCILFRRFISCSACFLLSLSVAKFIFFLLASFLFTCQLAEDVHGAYSKSANFSSIKIADAQQSNRIARVRFSGNNNVRNTTLRTIVRTQPNRELLSVPGLTVWYWVNQLNKNWGEPPSRLDRQTVSNDIQRIQTYYRSIGFLDAQVDTIIVEYGRNKYEVSFLIDEGRQATIRNVYYSGLPNFDDDRILERYFRRSAIIRNQINDTTFTVNRKFSNDLLATERNNLINLLRNNGYASVQRDSVNIFVQRNDDNLYDLDVLYLIQHGSTYTFGNLFMVLAAPAESDPSSVLIDTLEAPYTVPPARFIIQRDSAALTRVSFLQNLVSFVPGESYNHELYMQTIRRVQNTGMLAVRQFALNTEGGLPDFSSTDIPVLIDMQALPRQSIAFDVFGMQRLGFGAGAGVSYINNNLFGSAERLQIGIKGSFENAPNVSAGLLRSMEGSVEYSIPKITFPLSRFSNLSDFTNARTRYQFSIARINQLNFNVNANFRFNLKYEISHNSTNTSILDLIEFDWFDASPTARFRERIENEVSDPLQRERILNDFSQQFSSIIRYTYRQMNTDIVQRNSGHYQELSVEAGGTIPYLLERYLVRPGEPLQSTIPSLTLADSTLSYSRFIKTYVDYRRYSSLANNTVFAWRSFFGIAYAYGANPQIPLNRRFFAGGSNDIRGWPPLRLGPGNVGPGQVAINGADIKLALFAELRQILLRDFLSTNWAMAAFIDAGNIWNSPRSSFREGRFFIDSFYNEFAVGAGYGIRLDWEYVVFRIDAGYRIHDPAIVNNIRRGWFKSSNPYIHFGIGHSF